MKIYLRKWEKTDQKALIKLCNQAEECLIHIQKAVQNGG